MRRLRGWVLKFAGLFNKGRKDRELQEELESHIQMHTEDNIRSGMTPEESRRQAMVKFGGMESTKEACREQRSIQWLENLAQDLRFGARQLRKNPGFTLVATLTLALGIGANAVVFTFINAVLLKPVMAKKPQELIGIYQRERVGEGGGEQYRYFSYPDFVDLRSGGEAFMDLAAIDMGSVGWEDGDLMQRLPACLVSANFFSLMGVPPFLGRGFLPEEEISGASVAVLTYAFWQRLGGEAGIVGRKLKLSRGDVTVVGVMPEWFTGSRIIAPALYLPLGREQAFQSRSGQAAANILDDRSERLLTLLGRLRNGLTLRTAPGALSVLNARFRVAEANRPLPRTLVCAPPDRFDYHESPSEFANEVIPVAALAQTLALLVLLIASLNLANMMLARGAARRREIAVRLAMGAGRGRVLRQLLTEGLLVSAIGGAAALVLSTWSTGLLVSVMSREVMQQTSHFNAITDWRLIGALLAFVALATLFFALGPAASLSRLDFNADLKRSDHENPEGRLGVRGILAIGQMAFSLLLLVAAGLFTRSARNALASNPGFELGSAFYATLDPSLLGDSDAQARELVRAATERLAAFPGVEHASACLYVPFGRIRDQMTVSLGVANNLPGSKSLLATYNRVGTDYFRTLGLPLLKGREFERLEVESTNAPRVAIISQKIAEQFWPTQDPIGRLIQVSAGPAQVVGLVPEVIWSILDKESAPEIYEPLGQGEVGICRLEARMRPGVDPAAAMSAANRELHRLDPRIPLREIQTLTEMHSHSPPVMMTRIGAMLFGAFGVLAMILSFLGAYGLKSYNVARRTREIGIRIALGADRSDVVAMILWESARLAFWGLGIGFLLSLGAGRLASRFLYKVFAFDPLIFAAVPLLLLVVNLLACWLPARRASKLDPMVALRYE